MVGIWAKLDFKYNVRMFGEKYKLVFESGLEHFSNYC
jgi:hypothetical protein